MRLKIFLPREILIDEPVERVTLEMGEGSMTFLPRHIDYVSALVPGLLSYKTVDGAETFFAVDEGIVIKRASEVLVSTRNAIRGADLGTLRQKVEEEFQMVGERERMTKDALARLEAHFVRRFMELGK
jgi:F-type H+-transporting ATPase subunit epsilon